MPHLSPMSWLSMLMAMWFMMFISISSTWWYTPNLFNKINNKMKNNLNSQWLWILQDGWDFKQ